MHIFTHTHTYARVRTRTRRQSLDCHLDNLSPAARGPLQHIATHYCNTLQHTATHCYTLLQHTLDCLLNNLKMVSYFVINECVQTSRQVFRGKRFLEFVSDILTSQLVTGWRRFIGSPRLQIIFHKIATKYRSLLRKMTYKDKASYESSPPCMKRARQIPTKNKKTP